MANGTPDTALSLGCGACGCAGWIGTRILTDADGWLQYQIALNPQFKLLVIQIGLCNSYMQSLGAKPNSEYSHK